jgi:hypothetical protein
MYGDVAISLLSSIKVLYECGAGQSPCRSVGDKDDGGQK